VKNTVANLALLSALFASQFCFAEDKPAPATDLPQPEYRYNPIGKSDPFKPIPLSRAIVQSENQLTDRDINDIRLVGTALGSEMSAIIMISGKGVIARVGDKIGQKNGRIVSISNDRIVIRQPISDLNRQAPSDSGLRRQKYEDVVIGLSSERNEPSQQKQKNNSIINPSVPDNTNRLFLGRPGN
jgi:hypothetical protein